MILYNQWLVKQTAVAKPTSCGETINPGALWFLVEFLVIYFVMTWLKRKCCFGLNFVLTPHDQFLVWLLQRKQRFGQHAPCLFRGLPQWLLMMTVVVGWWWRWWWWLWLPEAPMLKDPGGGYWVDPHHNGVTVLCRNKTGQKIRRHCESFLFCMDDIAIFYIFLVFKHP